MHVVAADVTFKRRRTEGSKADAARERSSTWSFEGQLLSFPVSGGRKTRLWERDVCNGPAYARMAMAVGKGGFPYMPPELRGAIAGH